MSAEVRAFSPTLIQAESLRKSLRRFAKGAWPHVDPKALVWGWHLDAMCDHFAYYVMGEIRFLEVNISPRSTKSKLASVILPPWIWLHDPGHQFLTGSYALQLAQRDNLFSRRLIESEWFQERWGHEWRFSFDDKLKRQYSNDKGGRRIATSVDAAVTGEGGDTIIIDDPHNATEVESDAVRLATHDWWDYAISNRLNDPDKSGWILVGQRTGPDDLFSHIDETHDTKEIVKLIIPNEYDTSRKKLFMSRLPSTGKLIYKDPRNNDGELMAPTRISPAATKRLKRIMRHKYHFQYQQDPNASGGAILDKNKWKPWRGEMPECHLLLSCYDTAFEEDQENDYSARTDWGVFRHKELITNPETGESAVAKERNCIILLGAWRDRVGYPALLKEAKTHHNKLKPDYTLVEYKASGIVLAKELIRKRLKGVRKVRLDHGGRVKLDKTERAHLASPVLEDGLVYYADRTWAKPVIDECHMVPKGSHDDWADTVIMALVFLRRINEIGKWEDEDEDDQSVRLFKQTPQGEFKKPKRYYG